MKNAKTVYYLICAVSIIVALFTSLDTFDLRGEEPRRAVVAMEMFFSNEYIVPHLHGLPYYNKPPLFNWILVAFHNLFGSWEEWVIRLPGVLSLFLTAVFGYYTLRSYLGHTVALWSGFIFLTFGEMLFYGSVLSGEIDPFLTLITYLQVFVIFHYLQSKNWFLLFALSYALATIGFMTKGLPSVLIQGITLFVFLFYAKQLRKLFSWQHFVGILIFLCTISSYYYLYAQAGGDVITSTLNLINESSQKSFVENGWLAIVTHIAIFPFLVIGLLLPWSLLPLLLIYFNKKLLPFKFPPVVLYFALFILGNIAVYWVSPNSRNTYLYIFFPFFAIIIAYVLIHHFHHLIKKFQFLLMTMILLRLVYNVFVMPYQQKQIGYERHLDDALAILEGNDLTYLNKANDYTLSLDLSNSLSFERAVVVPWHMKYVIPYFYMNKTGKILPYETIPIKGKYYITPKSYLDKISNYNVRYTFMNYKNEVEYLLIQMKAD